MYSPTKPNNVMCIELTIKIPIIIGANPRANDFQKKVYKQGKRYQLKD